METPVFEILRRVLQERIAGMQDAGGGWTQAKESGAPGMWRPGLLGQSKGQGQSEGTANTDGSG